MSKAIMDIHNRTTEHAVFSILRHKLEEELGTSKRTDAVALDIFELFHRYEDELIRQNEYFQKVAFDKIMMTPTRPIFIETLPSPTLDK